MITAKINCSKIDNRFLFKGKTGMFLDVVLMANRDGTDQYDNDGMVIQSIPKENRLRGERGPILGNYKEMNRDSQPGPPPSEPDSPAPSEDDSIPF